MKKSFVIACTLLTAGSLFAQGTYVRAKQQAIRDSRMNDANQQHALTEANGGTAAAAPANPAAPAPAKPVDPALQATLNNISSLQGDFAAAINAPGGKPDATLKVSLLNDLVKAAQGNKKASDDSVKKLADDLSSAVAGNKKLALAQQTKLAQYVHALFNSSHLSDAQQQSVLASVQKILTDGGVPLSDAVNVVADLKAVVADTKQ